MLVVLLLFLLLVPVPIASFNLAALEDAASKHQVQTSQNGKPLTSTILFLPTEYYSPQISFQQKSIGVTFQGSLTELEQSCQSFDDLFQSEEGVQACLGRITSTAPDTLQISWNVSWVPPTSLWLDALAQQWPSVEPVYVTYNHLSGQRSTFSWKAVGRLFRNAIETGKLSVPLACIEGRTLLQFNDDNNKPKCNRISEELVYALDLQRNSLQNRKCADDLRLFLETGRRLPSRFDEWDDLVATSLSWSSVAGSNVLDVDPIEEGPGAAIVFLGAVALSVVGFAAILAPELIGQSLFGPPNYIVKPEDLNSFY